MGGVSCRLALLQHHVEHCWLLLSLSGPLSCWVRACVTPRHDSGVVLTGDCDMVMVHTHMTHTAQEKPGVTHTYGIRVRQHGAAQRAVDSRGPGPFVCLLLPHARQGRGRFCCCGRCVGLCASLAQSVCKCVWMLLPSTAGL